jgi:hypothetical protein
MKNLLDTIFGLLRGFSDPLPQSVILEPQSHTDADYEAIFGSVEVGATVASYDWRKHQPTAERQGATMDCVSFSRLSVAEHLAKKGDIKIENKEANWSDLYLAVASNTTTRGNSLIQVSEAFRKEGCVLQEMCQYDADMLTNPFGTWVKREVKYKATPKDARRYKGGNYSFVHVGRKDLMIQALEKTPLQIAVGLDYNWRTDTIVKPPKVKRAYHAIVLQHIDINGFYHIFDTDSKQNKVLSPDYPIETCLSFVDLPEDWRDRQKNNLNFLRDPKNGCIYQWGEGDHLWHPFVSGDDFTALYGDFATNQLTNGPTPTRIGWPIKK